MMGHLTRHLGARNLGGVQSCLSETAPASAQSVRTTLSPFADSALAEREKCKTARIRKSRHMPYTVGVIDNRRAKRRSRKPSTRRSRRSRRHGARPRGSEKAGYTTSSRRSGVTPEDSDTVNIVETGFRQVTELSN